MTALVGLALATAPADGRNDSTATWTAEVQAWRTAREADLTKPDGWLSVAGLYFLRNGVNTLGADPSADVHLPGGAAPADAGRLIYEGGHVRYEPVAGTSATLNDQVVNRPATVRPGDANGPADRLRIGRISVQLHESGARLGVRLRDPESSYRLHFTGLRWFAIDPSWRLSGRLIKYGTPRIVEVQNVLGDIEPMRSPGEVEVAIGGTTVRLIALEAAKGRLWLVFSDATAGPLTYRIRFLYTDAPDAAGRVDVDFNRAYNPPCAFNPHTTCPLPPRQNRLSVAITAGEQKYSGHTQTSAND